MILFDLETLINMEYHQFGIQSTFNKIFINILYSRKSFKLMMKSKDFDKEASRKLILIEKNMILK